MTPEVEKGEMVTALFDDRARDVMIVEAGE